MRTLCKRRRPSIVDDNQLWSPAGMKRERARDVAGKLSGREVLADNGGPWHGLGSHNEKNAPSAE